MKLENRICPYCKSEFSPTHPKQKYCIIRHRTRYAALRQKHKEIFKLNKYEQKLYKEIQGIKLTKNEQNIEYGTA